MSNTLYQQRWQNELDISLCAAVDLPTLARPDARRTLGLRDPIPAMLAVILGTNLLTDAKFTHTDRIVLIAVLAYCVVNAVLESVRKHGEGSESVLVLTFILGATMILIALAALWYSSRRGSISVGLSGFSHGWGMWANLGLVVLTTVLIVKQIPTRSPSITITGFWMIVGAITEELVWRVYLIHAVPMLLPTKKWRVTQAVLLCAAFFAAVHVFNKSASMLFGLFVTGALLGYITYFTKSVLVAAYLHVLFNSAGELGLLGGGITIAAYLVISLTSELTRRRAVDPIRSKGL